MPASYLPMGQTDDYRCFVLDPQVSTDQFITGYDIRPGAPAVVHHVTLWVVRLL